MIILFHGFGSNGTDSRTNTIIKEQFPDELVFTPSYDYTNASMSFVYLHSFISDALRANPDETQLVMIGISLGGFWARRMAYEFEADKLVLLNPSLEPHKTMIVHSGIDYKTGEEYTLSEDNIFDFRQFFISYDPAELSITVIVADDDDVVPQDGICNFIPADRGHIIQTTGGHRLEGTLTAHLSDIEFAVYSMNGGFCSD